MLEPAFPINEQARLRRLQSLDLLDSAAEDTIDTFTQLASEMTGMPISLVSLVDTDRQWFKSAVGSIGQGTQTARDVSFCGHTILDTGIFEVEDAATDERFADNPLVTGHPHVIHYAGVPIVMPGGGERLGSLCVIDHKPGKLTAEQRNLLTRLAEMLANVFLMREKDRSQARASELARQEANRARELADEANRAKSDFLSTMSHEIRTPINGVIGLGRLLSTQPLPPQARSYASMLNNCANSLLSLVDGILDLSKIEAGQMVLQATDTDLHTLIEELSDLHAVQAAVKGLHYTATSCPSLPRWVSLDGHKLRQILLNLLSNALKFTKRGSYSLNVDVADDQLIFEVRDSGIGIEPKSQEKLFARFTQVDSSTSKMYGGSGLGLAISRQLAVLMGGELRLESEVGVGSAFTLRLPLAVATARLPDPSICDAARPTTSAPRVLVVDDNEINLIVAAGLLEQLGFNEVTCVDSGENALASYAAHDYAVILMDCHMPGMDGYATTRALRQAGYQGLIIAVTASALLSDKQRCLAAGMDGFLSKPFAPEELLSTLQEVTERDARGMERLHDEKLSPMRLASIPH